MQCRRFLEGEYKYKVTDSLQYCREQKGLELFGYVIMTNHIHLICRAKETFQLSDILRDFKRHKGKYIIKEIKKKQVINLLYSFQQYNLVAKFNILIKK